MKDNDQGTPTTPIPETPHDEPDGTDADHTIEVQYGVGQGDNEDRLTARHSKRAILSLQIVNTPGGIGRTKALQKDGWEVQMHDGTTRVFPAGKLEPWHDDSATEVIVFLDYLNKSLMKQLDRTRAERDKFKLAKQRAEKELIRASKTPEDRKPKPPVPVLPRYDELKKVEAERDALKTEVERLKAQLATTSVEEKKQSLMPLKYEVKRLVHQIVDTDPSAHDDEQIALHMNDGWRPIDISTSSIFDEGHRLVTTQVILLQRAARDPAVQSPAVTTIQEALSGPIAQSLKNSFEETIRLQNKQMANEAADEMRQWVTDYHFGLPDLQLGGGNGQSI